MESEVRSSPSHTDMLYKEKTITRYVPFCTWKEIKEMSKSGYVNIASHSVNHLNLRKCAEEEILFELKESKKIIEKKCDIFVYPYGAYDDVVLRYANDIYKYSIGIGAEFNKYWIKVIKRIYADEMLSPVDKLSLKNKIIYSLRYLIPYKTRQKINKWIRN